MRAARVFALLTGLILWPWGGSALAAEGGPPANAVKAAYLVKFGGFIDWPPNAFSRPDPRFNLCIAGEDPFGHLLDQAARGRTVGGHPIQVEHLRRGPIDSGCQLLFVAGDAQPSVEAVLGAVRGKPVLTVTDLPSSAPDKGIINFVIRHNHVRFEIDNRLAGECGLRVSSKLLALAVAVRPRP